MFGASIVEAGKLIIFSNFESVNEAWANRKWHQGTLEIDLKKGSFEGFFSTASKVLIVNI